MSTQAPSIYTVARELLTGNMDLSTDDILARVKALGVTKSDADIRHAVNNTRSELRRRAKSKGKSTPAASKSPYSITRELLTADPTLSSDDLLAKVKARGVTKSDAAIREAIRTTRRDVLGAKPVPTAARTTAGPKPADQTDEAVLFSAIGQVNKTAQLCGGVSKARAIADAIRACGGVDVFLRRLDVVAEILGSETEQ
ncbi:hypothetical protein R5W24_000572 [Gemmata sp. JC717]|uniref:hypothetical protein n=1 Tax=Gemmata algarum TaxID=2975278 RepID=UPI0021BABBFB|nr:hypothetical protein [Gemmata algarum]MDY3551494.1 hypothetical protein [Gemmata algarum]